MPMPRLVLVAPIRVPVARSGADSVLEVRFALERVLVRAASPS